MRPQQRSGRRQGDGGKKYKQLKLHLSKTRLSRSLACILHPACSSLKRIVYGPYDFSNLDHITPCFTNTTYNFFPAPNIEEKKFLLIFHSRKIRNEKTSEKNLTLTIICSVVPCVRQYKSLLERHTFTLIKTLQSCIINTFPNSVI